MVGYTALATAFFQQIIDDLRDDSAPVTQSMALQWVLGDYGLEWWVNNVPALAERGVAQVRAALLEAGGWEATVAELGERPTWS